jgi:hypothetical protein
LGERLILPGSTSQDRCGALHGEPVDGAVWDRPGLTVFYGSDCFSEAIGPYISVMDHSNLIRELDASNRFGLDPRL